MAHPLDSCRAKIQRANENIANLNTEIARFLDETKLRVAVQDDEHTGEQIVTAVGGKAPPLRFAVLAGEIVHHLRSALDHVACQLVLLGGHQPTTKTEFPIFVTRDEYVARHVPKVQYMPDAAKALIERLQPFQQGHPAALAHPLWILHQMEITDKHRLLVVVIARAALTYIVSSGDAREIGGQLVRHTPAALSSEGETEVARLRFPRSVNVKPELSQAVVFNDVGTADNEAVIPLLQNLSDAVASGAALFDRFFP